MIVSTPDHMHGADLAGGDVARQARLRAEAAGPQPGGAAGDVRRWRRSRESSRRWGRRFTATTAYRTGGADAARRGDRQGERSPLLDRPRTAAAGDGAARIGPIRCRRRSTGSCGRAWRRRSRTSKDSITRSTGGCGATTAAACSATWRCHLFDPIFTGLDLQAPLTVDRTGRRTCATRSRPITKSSTRSPARRRRPRS